MKCLLIYPPQWIPTNPYFSIPLLSAQLQEAGFDVESIDLSIDFYNKILSCDFLKYSFEFSKEQLNNINNEYHFLVTQRKINETDIKTKILLSKYKCLNDYFSNKVSKAKKAIKYIDEALDIIRSDKFYNFSSYYKAQRIVEYALELALLPYAPSEIKLNNYCNPLFMANYQDIVYQTSDEEINPFISFYREQFYKKVFDYDLIVFSVTGKTQLVPAFTLAKLLKEEFNCNAHITLGGNLINKVSDNFTKYPDFFDNFFDSLLVGDGENSVVKLANVVSNNQKLDSVPGLIYKNNKTIVKNKFLPIENLNSVAPISLEGYSLNKYFAPESIMLIQATKGCYWGKCTFCDLTYGKIYNQKNIKKLVDEIQYYYESYKVKKFWFVDETISPAYYLQFANEIIKRNLKINYYGLARLEDGFTEENCKIMYESGLKCLMWGYECASSRVLELMNKGICAENRLQILRNASNAGIWNHLFLIFGFPSETEIEANQTISVVVDNKDIIHSYLPHTFSLQRHSSINNDLKKYFISEIVDKEEFEECFDNSFNSSPMLLSKEILDYKIKFLNKLFWEDRQTSVIRYLFSTDFLLYLSKYGKTGMQKQSYIFPENINKF